MHAQTLVVLEFCVVVGSEAVVAYAKDTLYMIKTLKEFQHVDEHGRDKGVLVREKCKDLVELLTNEALLGEARRTGTVPNTSRPKSAEPLYVDPKRRKRLGAGEGAFETLQDMDEAEAMRVALAASRRDSGQQPLK